MKNINELNQKIALLKKQGYDVQTISDGYHTFSELYELRLAYNAALFNEWTSGKKYDVHKSKTFQDIETGEYTQWEGWFIVVAETPNGQIGNHYPVAAWDKFKVAEKEKANAWDGNMPDTICERLFQL